MLAVKKNPMPRRKKLPQKKSIQKARITAGQYLADILIDIGYLITEPFETHYPHRRRLEGWPEDIPLCRIRQEVRRMRDRGWIQEAEKNGKKFLQLTQRGRLEILYKRLKGVSRIQKIDWDGKWRLVMFDIPEEGKSERKTLRKLLKSLGFYLMQKSVYVCPHEIPTDALSYLKESGLWVYIRFAQIERMEDDSDIRKYFNLE